MTIFALGRGYPFHKKKGSLSQLGNPSWRYFGSLGTPPGGLGHILSPSLGFLWFWRHLRHERVVPFWGQNATTNRLFAVLFFNVFLSARFSWFCVILSAPRLHFGRLLEVILGAFSGTLDFLFLMTPTMNITHFWRPEVLKIEAFSRSFSRVDFGRPPGRDFWRFWWFWELPGAPFWRPGAPFLETEKKYEKKCQKRERE